MAKNLVGYSRAGDVFHYRWAARRCLKLIYPKSTLRKVVVEGSDEIQKGGEYVIDLTEYYETAGQPKKTDYYQLKHTVVRKTKPFTLSDLKPTIEGFAKRFNQHKKALISKEIELGFSIITNRKVSDTVKKNLLALAIGQQVDTKFKATIERYARLKGPQLKLFCSLFKIEDGEGDYIIQNTELKKEIAQLTTGVVDNSQIDSIETLIQKRVLPDSDGIILPEDILEKFGFSSVRELYPAPALWEAGGNIIPRKQHAVLQESIKKSVHPVIIYAAGGVGKSVFTQQLINSLDDGSSGIAYDCFGAGRYRNRSESRHRHRDALVQIVNELAAKGLCDPLLVQDTALEEGIMKKFISRIDTVVKSLKKGNKLAQLFIVIDAADNAEMAAEEFNQSCFAKELLREVIPQDCKLVYLCRTERIHLLQPKSTISRYELEAFSETESLENLRKIFPKATPEDGKEFHRLTSANPRVQANALDVRYESVALLLNELGPFGTSVDKQIEAQLAAAVLKVKDLLPSNFQEKIDAICLGLACLPPHIPIEVLCKASQVDAETIKSFVADIGRSLWLSDATIQFRDEPTETWFRNTFLATQQDYEKYIVTLEPLANELTYVAEVLPQLYLQAGQYEKLISLALSDKYLPESNPIDARNVRVYRLQFAFKAALKNGQHKDAIKIAMRAGEEVAGNERQLGLFKANIDLLTSLQSKDKVQEIAFKRLLSGAWNGSENIYTSSLLSGIKEYHGEARGFIRSAINWLNIHFRELRKEKDRFRQDQVNDADLLELTYALLNVHGVKVSLDFIFSFRAEGTFRIVRSLTKRLIDTGRFTEIEEYSYACIQKPYIQVAITHELLQVGKYPRKKEIKSCLDIMCSSKRIKKPDNTFNDQTIPAIVSFAEVCFHYNLSPQLILNMLGYYLPVQASRMVGDSHFSTDRTLFLKALAIRTLLTEKSEVDFDEILPAGIKNEEKEYQSDNDLRKFKEVINGLLPWFLLRVQLLSNPSFDLVGSIKDVSEISQNARNRRYGQYDTLPSEIAELLGSLLLLYQQGTKEQINSLYDIYLKNDKAFTIEARLHTLRGVYRLNHLESIRQELELSTYEIIKNQKEDGPEEIAGRYISLARSVLVASPQSGGDASYYFDEAIKIASKFGDEIVQRWEAIVALAEKAALLPKTASTDKLSYRFIRCAELVGENVSREKYWSRSGAIRACTMLSAGMGISAMSRWRDRHIGRFQYQFETLLRELVNSKVLKPSVGWSLASFLPEHQLKEFLSICLKNEVSPNIRQIILDDAVHFLRQEGATGKFWRDLKVIADQFNLNNSDLNHAYSFYPEIENTSRVHETSASQNDSASSTKKDNWDDIFKKNAVVSPEKLSELIVKVRSDNSKNKYGRDVKELLKQGFHRIGQSQIREYIDSILSLEELNHYDVQEILSKIPPELMNKVSFKSKWPDILFKFGKTYAHDLVSQYTFDSLINSFHLDKAMIEKVKSGMFSGLIQGSEIGEAATFFEFVSIAVDFIDPSQASELAEYGITRFEMHMEHDFADGPWGDWLKVPSQIPMTIAGFIWSALGSPRSAERWRAVHSIQKLAELRCVDILDSLFQWITINKVEAFGSKDFPFYSLHAKQYLLIALVQVSYQHPALLIKYKTVFLPLVKERHILIQKLASIIVLNIEKPFPGTYEGEIIADTTVAGKSKIPVKKEKYNYTTDSYQHKENRIATDLDFHFAYDFDRYWFEPLGDVFGVPAKQVEDLAANIIINEWNLSDKNGYYNDPRVGLWNRSSGDRETWHDHFSYPRTDTLDFYLSYHSMLVVASDLVDNMPVISTNDYDSNDWEEWLSRHWLTKDDGKLIADCRDFLPLARPKWISSTFDKNTWKTDVADTDFLGILKVDEKNNQWLNIKGYWHERHEGRTETFFLSTALVSKDTSGALLRALGTAQDSSDYKLPNFEEVDMEFTAGEFVLKGWINERSISKRLDEYDPNADQLDFPYYSIGTSIAEQAGIASDADGKLWHNLKSGTLELVCDTWFSYREQRDEEPTQQGMRMKATLSFLTELCKKMSCDIIFDVGLKRDFSYKYNTETRDYAKPIHKIFILSANGKLRTTNADYQLGKAPRK